MKHRISKRVISVLLSVMLLFMLAVGASAEAPTKYFGPENIVRRMACPEDGCSGMLWLMCARDGTQNYTTTHKPLFSEECTVIHITSRIRVDCDTCSYIEHEPAGHACWELHSSCSKGEYHPCLYQRPVLY